ncbi:MAG: hypothetical protein II126_03545 [Erysipelotrichaceae bacterium]|nr:hypothetical protein [Erysipelotrichaceae bacterium]
MTQTEGENIFNSYIQTVTIHVKGGYRVREVIKDDDNKIIYDGINYYVEVEVEDDLKGHLDVYTHIIDSIDGNYNEYKEMIFTNTEKSGRLRIQKLVEGLGNDKFTFTIDLKDEDGNPLTGEFRTVLTPAGSQYKPPVVMMTFPTTITLSGGDNFMILGLPVGTQYEVEEINIPEYWQLIKVDGAKGVIDVEKDNDIVLVTFVNKKDVPGGDPTSITLNARKTLEGGTIDEGNDFLFQLLDEKMNVLQTVSVDSLGAATSGITFKPIEYPFSKEASQHTYYIKEIQGSDANIIYDQTTYVVKVDVTPPEKLPGAMKAEYKYYKYVLDEET